MGSLAELKELIGLAENGLFGAIPFATRPLAEAAQTLADLKDGKIVGRGSNSQVKLTDGPAGWNECWL